MTEPPAKAISRALDNPVRAAWAVRTLALVATCMPMKPAKPEQKAPTTKDRPTIGDEVSAGLVTANKVATQTTKMARILYSALRKAIAPSAMWPAILRILASPGS